MIPFPPDWLIITVASIGIVIVGLLTIAACRADDVDDWEDRRARFENERTHGFDALEAVLARRVQTRNTFTGNRFVDNGAHGITVTSEPEVPTPVERKPKRRMWGRE